MKKLILLVTWFFASFFAEVSIAQSEASIETRLAVVSAVQGYNLTVHSGTGDGNYKAGSVSTIYADSAPAGKIFSNWVVIKGNPVIDNKYSSLAFLTMGDRTTIVSAVYRDIPRGPKGYLYCADENQACLISSPTDVAYGANGKFVYKYGVDRPITFNNATFGDPNPNVRKAGFLKTNYVTYALTVNGGSGDGRYEPNTNISIKADAPPAGKVFHRWTVTAGSPLLTNYAAESTDLNIGGAAAAVTATYKDARIGAPPAGYVFSAPAGGVVLFANSVDVAYGANGKFFYQYDVKGPITFNDWTFGDPIPGVAKAGYERAKSPNGTNKMAINEMLKPGEKLVSSNNRYRLEMQSDRNLVIYNEYDLPVWATNTGAWPAVASEKTRLIMQSDGNLVLYEFGTRSPIWATSTPGSGSTVFKLLDDGTLALYSARGLVWSANKPR